MMDSSRRFPPKCKRSLSTSPPREITEISVVSAPISTTMIPVGSLTSRPSPTASAIGFSQSRTFFGFILLLKNISKKAFFSTSVMSVGTATIYSAPWVFPLAFFSINSKIIVCILLKSAITPFTIGKVTLMDSGAFSYIAYAASPYAYIWFLLIIAMVFFSFKTLPVALQYTFRLQVPKSIP